MRIESTSQQRLTESAEALAMIEQAGGFVPNSFFAMARRPRMLELISELCMEVLVREGAISLELRWLVAHIASRAAGCEYCWAHTATNASNLAGVDPKKIESAWEYQTSGLFSDAERAAMEFALAAAQVPNVVDEQHFVELHQWFDDDQIVDLMSVIALFGWFNRWNDSMATQLEDAPLGFANRHLSSTGWEPGRHSM